MNIIIKNTVWVVLFILSIQLTRAQQNDISFFAKDIPLSIALEEIAKKYNLKFAFDPDTFCKIDANFTLKNSSAEEFFELLNKKYFINAKLIDGTWVLIMDKPDIIESQNPPEILPVIVSGYVKDEMTGEDLIYCNVTWEPDKGTMTNELGFFRFEIPAADSVHIQISHLGYKKKDTLISTGERAMIYLKPSDVELSPINVVHYEKHVLQASPKPEIIGFNPLKSSNVPRISNDDLGNALLLIPGVNFLYGGASGLSIRGGSPSDNLVLFDGIPVLETSHLLGNMSVLNAKFVKQAFVSRGGFGTEFGDRVAGLIRLSGKSGKNNRPYLDLSANLLNYNVLANIPLTNKFSVTAAWRRSFIDRWQNYLYFRLINDIAESDDDPVRSTIIPTITYEDINAKISFHPSDNFEFNINLLYGKDHQSRDFELIRTKDYYRNEMLNGKNLGLSLNWNWQVNDEWLHSFSAGFSNLDRKVVDETGELIEITEIIENPGQGVGKGKGLAKTRERTFTRLTYDIDNGSNHIEEYRAAWKTEFNKGILGNEAGFGFTSNSYSYNFFAQRTEENLQVDSIVDNATLSMVNGFIQQRVDLRNWINLRWGIRANIDLDNKETYWQPRGGIEIIPANTINFYFLSGIYYQFLSGVKRFDSDGHFNQIWYLPRKDETGIAKGIHYVFGTKYQKDGWFIDVEGYLKNISGKVNFFAEEISTGVERTIAYFPRECDERTRGLDLFLQKKHFIFNHMIGYSLSETEEKTEDFLDDQWYPGYNDRSHRLKITEMIKWNNWNFTASLQLASGLPVIRPEQTQPALDFNRSDHLCQLDLAIIREFRTPHLFINTGASLLNVLNRENIIEVDYLRFSSDTGSLTVRSDISALAFTPVFFINFKIQ